MTTATRPSLVRRRRHLLVGVTGFAACSLLVAACSGGAEPAAAPPVDASSVASSTSTGPDPDEVGTATQDPGATQPVAPGTVRVEVGSAHGSTDYHYDKVRLEEPSGVKIRLKFVNHTDAKDEIGHNWVLVRPGQENEVVASGKAAGDDKDWLDVDDPAILAHTRLIEGGQSNTVTFRAPPGPYTYLCTFPEHYAGGEKGTLVIK